MCFFACEKQFFGCGTFPQALFAACKIYFSDNAGVPLSNLTQVLVGGKLFTCTPCSHSLSLRSPPLFAQILVGLVNSVPPTQAMRIISSCFVPAVSAAPMLSTTSELVRSSERTEARLMSLRSSVIRKAKDLLVLESTH